MSLKEKTELIRQQVTMPMILEAYGYGVRPGATRGRIPCMLHHGTHNNFSYNDKVFHCFTCGAKGNLIGFVMQYRQLDFKDALTEINSLFNLWDDSRPMTFSERQKLKQAADRRRFEQRIEAMQAQRESDRIDALERRYDRYEYAIEHYAPRSPNEEWDERYCEALMKMNIVKYNLALI